MNFTQFMMPNGRQEKTSITRSNEIEAMAKTLVDAGYVFEIEMLSDYRTISMEVVNKANPEEVIASKLVENGPRVPEAVDDMVKKAIHALSAKSNCPTT
jgi:ribosomal protein S8